MTNNNDNIGFISGTSIPIAWLEEVVSKAHGEKAVVSIVEPLGDDAVGFMSIMRRVHLETEDGSEYSPKTVIIKTPSTAGGMEAITAAGGVERDAPPPIDLQVVFHGTECTTLQVLQKNKSSHSLKIPRVYAANSMSSSAPCILMEDIVNTRVIDLIEGFNENQLYQLVDQIVELQAYSLLNEDWKEPESPEKVKLAESSDGMLKGIFDNFFTKYHSTFGDFGWKLKKNTLDSKENYTLSTQRQYTLGDRVAVLCHGDMWTANFLWRGDELAAVVDWQLSHPGSPVEDILRILSTCTSSHNRKTLTKPLLDYYYTNLQKKVGKMPFTREELDEEMKHFLPYGCVWTVFANAFWVPQVLVKEVRIKESFDRCLTYLEDTANAYGW